LRNLDSYNILFEKLYDSERISDVQNEGNIQVGSLQNTDVLGVALYDLNCFSSGMIPGVIINDDALGTSALISFTVAVNIGKMLDIAEVQSIRIEYSDHIIIITSFACDSLILVILARRTAPLPNLKQRINKLITLLDQVLNTDAALKQKPDITASQRLTCSISNAPLSLIELSDNSIRKISLLLQDFLRDSGYPEQLLQAHTKRSMMIEHLECASEGNIDIDSLELLSRICDRNSIPRIKHYLGKGNWGAVYLLTNNTVLKITRDAKEARTCTSIIGKHNSCIVDIFQVFRLSIGGLKTPYYFIVRENIDTLETLIDEETELLELMQQILSESYKDARSDNSLKISDIAKNNERRNLWDRAYAPAMKINRELKENCILFSDFHKDNIGIKNGQFCIFDLSLSEGPPVSMDEIDLTL
jgi:hypothetical protein